MENKKLITIAKANIWQAVRDYSAHTDETDVLDNISEDFVRQLAVDSVNAKADLLTPFESPPLGIIDAILPHHRGGADAPKPAFQRHFFALLRQF